MNHSGGRLCLVDLRSCARSTCSGRCGCAVSVASSGSVSGSGSYMDPGSGGTSLMFLSGICRLSDAALSPLGTGMSCAGGSRIGR